MNEQADLRANLPDIIFLAGLMRSGKDTIAELLVQYAGYVRIAFADALKEEIAAHYGVTVEHINQHKAEFRSILQEWGVAKREADPEYWIKEWFKRAEPFLEAGIGVVCTDCRFLNEAAYGIKIGAMLLRVIIPEDLRIERLIATDGPNFNREALNHPSEQYIAQMVPHADFPGNLDRDLILPTLEDTYYKLLYLGEAVLPTVT